VCGTRQPNGRFCRNDVTVAVRLPAGRSAPWFRRCLDQLGNVAEVVTFEASQTEHADSADVVLDLDDRSEIGCDRCTHARWYFAFGKARSRLPTFAVEAEHGDLLQVSLIENRDGIERSVRSGTFALLGTHRRSVAALLEECARWPALQIAFASESTSTRRPAAAVPGRPALPERNTTRLPLRSTYRQLGRICKRIVERTFVVGEWTVGIIESAPSAFLDPTFRPRVRWLEGPRHESLADPFVVDTHSQGITLLCERWTSAGGRGRIVRLTASRADVRIQEEFHEPHHVSYPFVVRDENVTYCVPERHESGCLALYRIDDTGWHFERTLLALAAVDATLFRHEGRWWLFTGDESRLSNVNLFAYSAHTLCGPWRSHVRNPIKTDVRSARSAGPPFVVDGNLIRPAQDCSQTYGGAIAFNRVDRLDDFEFSETVVARFDPRQLDGSWDGCHTLSFAGRVCAIDARRDRFEITLPLRRMANRVRRFIAREND